VHGVVFVALRHHLKEVGDETLLAECFPEPSSYLAIGEYPDEDLLQIAAKIAARMTGVSAAEVMRGLGEGVPPALKRIAPTVLPKAASLDELLDQLERGGVGGARWVLPRFEVAREDRRISLTHRGATGLCRFDEGLLTGFASLAGENVGLRHPTCRQRRERECVFVLRQLPGDRTTNRPSATLGRATTRPLGDK
jgi:hypothetical protein